MDKKRGQVKSLIMRYFGIIAVAGIAITICGITKREYFAK